MLLATQWLPNSSSEEPMYYATSQLNIVNRNGAVFLVFGWVFFFCFVFVRKKEEEEGKRKSEDELEKNH